MTSTFNRLPRMFLEVVPEEEKINFVLPKMPLVGTGKGKADDIAFR